MLDNILSISNGWQNRFWLYSLLGTVTALLAGYLIATMGMVGSAVIVVIPISLLLLTGILLEPKLGLMIYVQLSFLVPFLSRFLSVNIPLGTLIEAILVLTLLSLMINGKRMNWSQLNQPAFYLIATWFFFTFLELFNPEMPNQFSWLYRFRAFSFQWLMAAILVLVIPITKRDIIILVRIWLVWSFMAALWAFKQQYLGLTAREMSWLMNFGAKTHLLFGHLRSFSFYTDAAQLGAEMAGATLVCLILMTESKGWLTRLVYLFLALVFFWGYAVSGTRSALFVLLVGFPFYLVIKRDFFKLLIGSFIGVFLFCILWFTSLGNTNYQVYRMRTALRPSQDESFKLRLENQEKLKSYLAPLPFGVGLGTSGTPGDRYNPTHWAALIPPDTWYVVVWMETGIVGLSLYVGILVTLVLIGTYRVWRLKDPTLRIIITALLAEFVGIAVMGYSNTVLGQLPTCSILFMETILFTTCNRWDKQPDEQEMDSMAYKKAAVS